jgi:hypothetical protein
MMFSLFLVFGLILCVLARSGRAEVGIQQQWIVGQVVQTTSGSVKGSRASAAELFDVSEYVGIPYAESTSGQNRFMAPVRLRANGTIDATTYVRYHNHSFRLKTNSLFLESV